MYCLVNWAKCMGFGKLSYQTVAFGFTVLANSKVRQPDKSHAIIATSQLDKMHTVTCKYLTGYDDTCSTGRLQGSNDCTLNKNLDKNLRLQSRRKIIILLQNISLIERQ